MRICGDGALTVLTEPTIRVFENAVVEVTPAAVTCSPGGLVANVSGTAVELSDTVPVSPSGSVAVRRSSRYDGLSGSGTVTLPVGPATVCTTCSWQEFANGQWCKMSCHVSVTGFGTSSVAEPANEINSPVFHCDAGVVGEVIVGTGGALPGNTPTVVSVHAPSASVTRSRTVTAARVE